MIYFRIYLIVSIETLIETGIFLTKESVTSKWWKIYFNLIVESIETLVETGLLLTKVQVIVELVAYAFIKRFFVVVKIALAKDSVYRKFVST
mgnify:CR=1 FL=1